MKFKFLFKKTRVVALSLVIIIFTSAANAKSQATTHTFSQLADDYFNTVYFPLNPTEATQLGIHTYDDKLEDYSREGINHKIALLKQYEKKVSAFNASSLDEHTQADRELVLNHIRSKLLSLQKIREWENNPDIYSSGITYSAFVLLKRKFAPANNRLHSIIEREKLMPAALLEARKNLNNPPKIYTQIALEQLPGLIEFFQNDVPTILVDVNDASLKNQFATTNANVIKALTDYQVWLTQDVLPRSHGDFRIGKDTFEKKLKYDEMVETPLDKLVAIDMADMRHNQDEFARIAKEIDPNKTPQQILAELVANHPAPDQLLNAFQSKFNNLIKFIKDKHIITIPSDVQPTMEESPPFLRAITAASMDIPGPFEKVAKEAYFNVTLPDSSWDNEKTNDYMAAFDDASISNTAVHEAYPGHYVQFLWMPKLHDHVRQIIGASTNEEGWAHYCEQMMLDEGLASPEYGVKDVREMKFMRLSQLVDALWRNARFIVGIKMHTGEMTFDQAVDFFVKEGYQTRVVGVMEAKRGTSDPTYLYYTLGKLEILKLREDVKAKQGAEFSLLKFHDDFMRQGFPPIKIVRKAMLGDDSPVL